MQNNDPLAAQMAIGILEAIMLHADKVIDPKQFAMLMANAARAAVEDYLIQERSMAYALACNLLQIKNLIEYEETYGATEFFQDHFPRAMIGANQIISHYESIKGPLIKKNLQ